MHIGSKLALHPAAPGSMLQRFIAWNCGQRLDNVDRTHIVLASGKLALPKHFKSQHFPCLLEVQQFYQVGSEQKLLLRSEKAFFH